MDRTEALKSLRGPVIPVITHYRDDLSVDHETIRRDVRYLVEHGIGHGHGVLLGAGAGGDFPMLTLDERKEVAETIVNAAGGDVPVVVGAQDTDVRAMIELARCAEEMGAAAIQLAPAFYYASSDDDCLRLFHAVHDQTTTLGIMIYNTYWEGYDMSLDQLERLSELPRCVSLKWSTGKGVGAYLRGVARFADRLAVFDNFGLHVMNHMLGGAGFVTHLSNVWPAHDLEVWRRMEEGDYAGAQEMLTAVNWPWYDFRVKMGGRTGAESPVVNAALELCGRRGGPVRLPTRVLDDEERSELAAVMSEIGVPSLR